MPPAQKCKQEALSTTTLTGSLPRCNRIAELLCPLGDQRCYFLNTSLIKVATDLFIKQISASCFANTVAWTKHTQRPVL
jgi:hypothetical protein